jgi:hypothetical protein
MTTRLSDMSGEQLWEWYAAQPQDSESTLSMLRDIVYRETVIEVTAKMQAKMEAVMGKLYGEVS